MAKWIQNISVMLKSKTKLCIKLTNLKLSVKEIKNATHSIIRKK